MKTEKIKFENSLFYPLPSVEFMFCKWDRDYESTIVMGKIEKPYNKCYVHLAWLCWSYRFSFIYRKFKK